jgi:hypothetical protein
LFKKTEREGTKNLGSSGVIFGIKYTKIKVFFTFAHPYYRNILFFSKKMNIYRRVLSVELLFSLATTLKHPPELNKFPTANGGKKRWFIKFIRAVLKIPMATALVIFGVLFRS